MIGATLPMIGSRDSFCDVPDAMSQDDKLIDLSTERAKRVHDLNEKRLNEVRQAFEQAMPLGKSKKKSKNKPKKR
ncbi:MAG TPA: hypothetical protein VNV36_20770 [Pseudomonas sp.]|uniref:hypothetical protein n=1 Tax=Pseudomonas sp. TaxID=306 RepID=UPI002CA9510E|nr:hypothetical protein [Pseudomonas sp.]HWH89190.1 hypothetical protein [Pseudomonas sp.]